MTVTTFPSSPTSPLRKNAVLLIGAVVILLLLPLALPQGSIALYWRVLGFTVLTMGTLYAFFFRSALMAVGVSVTFGSMFEAAIKYIPENKVEPIFAYIGRDLPIYALIFGLLLSFFIGRSRGRRQTSVPPIFFLVLCFLLNLFMQLFNPNSSSPIASLLNSRIFWEMLPLYFLGFYFLRTLTAWRVVFVTFAVLTAINGAVAVYQSSVGPEAIAQWGPGYRTAIFDRGRTLLTEDGQESFRPFGLGTDIGFSAYLGVPTIPMLVTLLVARGRNSSTSGIFSLFGRFLRLGVVGALIGGCVAAIVVSGSRSAIVLGVFTAAVSLLFFTWRASKLQLLVGIGISLLLGLAAVQVVAVVAPNFAERYRSIASLDTTVETFGRENRLVQITTIPVDIARRYPFGAGLDNLGPGADFANRLAGTFSRPQVENTENNLNLALLGLGVPGLLLWLALHWKFIDLCWRARQKVSDPEVKIYLGSGFLIMMNMLIAWPFGNLISFPQNLLFWLIPGMVLGTAAHYADRPVR